MLRRLYSAALAAAVLVVSGGDLASTAQAGQRCPHCQKLRHSRNGSARPLAGAASRLTDGLIDATVPDYGYVHGAARNGLFYNYYVPGSDCGGVPAQLYVSPRPTPPLVGHTYITYEPLMPHEFLYRHSRIYYRNDGRLLPGNVTTVLWW